MNLRRGRGKKSLCKDPPDCAAIYCSLERETALAEADFYIGLQPLRPTCRRTIYTLKISLESVLFFEKSLLSSYGISPAVLSNVLYHPTQDLGGHIARLGRDGLIVPSARASGSNLAFILRISLLAMNLKLGR